MSRIGKKAIAVPSGVKVEQKGQHFKVTGPKGTLELDTHPEIDVKVEDNQ
ncbi:MAG: 50S ribosomal protein L6, partial [Planctomycetota bacterium]